MVKNIFLLALLCVAALSVTDKEILQLTLNGLFEQNKLSDPKTVVPCFDDDSAHKTVVFVGTLLDKAAKGSISDLLSLKDLVEAFGKSLPDSVKDCLSGNDQFTALGIKYGITNTTDTSALEKKIIAYVTLHYLTVHKFLGGLNDNWKAAKYYQVGYDAATFGHTVVGLRKSLPQLTDKEILQQTMNGLFEQNKLPDPSTVVPCFDDATAHSTVLFIGTVLDKAAKGSISDLLSLKDLIQKFGDSIPKPVKDCLNGNAEFTALGVKYGVTPTTNSSDIEKKVISYVTLHYLTVHKWLGDLNTEWKAGKYYQVGFDAAKDGHVILGMSNQLPEITDKQTLQQTMNGLFEQNKLPDPKTVVPCFDDATAKNTVAFMTTLLSKAAKGSISDLISLQDLVTKFIASVPQPVQDCLNGNAQFTALGVKYGITPDTDVDKLKNKIIAYVTLHYLQVHGWLGKLNDEWVGGKFYQTGFDAATYGHTVLGMTEKDVKYLRA